MGSKKNQIAAGEFKAKCLQLMDTVNTKRTTIVITKRGKPIAKLAPIEDDEPLDLFGAMTNSVTIKGDIIKPIEENWDANQ